MWNDQRAGTYDNLKWIKDNSQVNKIIDLSNIQTNEKILEVGCGTGILTEAIASQTSSIYSSFDALDQSKAMLDKALIKNIENVHFIHSSIELFEPTYKYDVIIMRGVLHHVKNIERVLKKCHSILNNNGRVIIAEGIPTADGYTIFHDALLIKEKRHVLSIGEWIDVTEKAGFKYQNIYRGLFENCSLNNILNNDGTLTNTKKSNIIQKYIKATSVEKKSYNIKYIEDDIICDFAYVIIQGIK